MVDQPQKAFVIGWPISHSLSPALHTYWLDFHEINGSYEKIAVPPEKLEEFLDNLPGSAFIGGNITIPHKEMAFGFIKDHKSAAIQLEATNTIWIEGSKLVADNTDGYGFTANLDDFSTDWRNAQSALVIGAGGAAKAVVISLTNAGIKNIVIANRTLSRAQDLAQKFGPSCRAGMLEELPVVLEKTNLLINTTSMGMKNQPPLKIDLAPMPADAIVTDIVYNPLQTPLLKQATSLNLIAIDGIGMLMHQAVPGFEKWFGVRPNVTPQLRAYMLKQLEAVNT